MDFVLGLPLSPKKRDAIWVIIDRLTKPTYFILVHKNFSLDMLVELYVSEIVILHGVPVSIILVRDTRFTSRFWNKLQEALGTQLHFSITFHPQANGQFERVSFDVVFWNSKYLSLVEFAYNNSYQSNIKMALYEALYSCKCRTPLYWTELSEKKIHGVDLSYADLKRKEIEFQVSDKVFLKVSPWKKVFRFSRKGKLSPQFIRPYEIIEKIGPVAYRLSLTEFTMFFMCPCYDDPSHVISLTEVEIQPDMTYGEKPIKILACEMKELRNKKVALVKVLWQRHSIEEATWELKDTMRKQYPNLFTGKIFKDGNF
ncbi:reverse transcriptase [Gossypium australe]|uniref:Reverse transcriptase n=1 Tax=Gossypium australe TaxID=47621 RepID=A0A5B6WZP5_9ROSI|nr:reverse transcriptase [Gossypium australe]